MIRHYNKKKAGVSGRFLVVFSSGCLVSGKTFFQPANHSAPAASGAVNENGVWSQQLQHPAGRCNMFFVVVRFWNVFEEVFMYVLHGLCGL